MKSALHAGWYVGMYKSKSNMKKNYTFLSKDEIDVDLVKNTKIFHFGSLSSTSVISKSATEFAVKSAKDSGALISYDPNYREPLWKTQDDAVTVMKNDLRYVDIVKLSLEEAIMITGKDDVKSAISDISNFGAKIILVTDGGNGVNFFYNGKFGFLPSLSIKPVDTTGAGDIFFGTFLSEFIDFNKPIVDFNFEDVKKCVKIAVKSSGLSTLKHGGVASIPDKSMIY